MKKNRKKQNVQWVLALLIGFAIVNALCFCYACQAGWLDTPNGAAPSAWQPGALLVHGTEGYGIARVDGKRPPQPGGNSGYALLMGSSHTQGKKVRPYSNRMIPSKRCACGHLQ